MVRKVFADVQMLALIRTSVTIVGTRGRRVWGWLFWRTITPKHLPHDERCNSGPEILNVWWAMRKGSEGMGAFGELRLSFFLSRRHALARGGVINCVHGPCEH